jgi:hypothetical protein
VAARVPYIVAQPRGGVVAADDFFVLNVLANANDSSALPLQYQWLKDGNVLAGQTSSTLVLGPVASSDEGSYSAVVTGSYGYQTKTDSVVIDVASPLQIAGIPPTLSLNSGDTLRLAVQVTSGDAPFSYGWKKNGTTLPQVTGPDLVLPSGQWAAGDVYQVTVSNSFGSQSLSSTVAFPPITASLSGIISDVGLIRDVAPLPETPYLVVSSGTMGIVIVDTTVTPWRIVGSESQPVNASVGSRIVVVGNKVLVSGTTGRVVDISDVSHPRAVASFPFSGSSMVVRGSRAYLASGGSLQVVDISNFTAPNLVTAVPLTTATIRALALSPVAPVLYVAASDSLKIVDISQPTPAVTDSIPLTGTVSAVAVNGAGTVLAVMQTGLNQHLLQLFDVGTATAPVARGSLSNNAFSNMENLAFGGDTLLIWGGTAVSPRRTFVNVSNPNAPVLGTIESSFVDRAVGYGSDFVIVVGSTATRYSGVGTVFVAGPKIASRTLDATTAIWANASGSSIIEARPGALYFLTAGSGVVPDIAAVAPITISDIAVQGNYAIFTNNGTAPLRVYNMTSPSAPSEAFSLSTVASRNIVLSGDGYAYTSEVNNRVAVLDLTTLPAVSVARYVDFPSNVLSVAINSQKTHLFVLGGNTLRVMDISGSHRTNPIELRSVTLPESASGKMRVLGDTLVVPSTSNLKLFVYNITDPVTPALTQTITSAGSIKEISTDGGLLLVPSSTGVAVYRFNPAISQYVLAVTVPKSSAVADSSMVSALLRGGNLFTAEQTGAFLGVHSLSGV